MKDIKKSIENELIEKIKERIKERTSWTCKCGCVTFDNYKCRQCGCSPIYGEIDYLTFEEILDTFKQAEKKE
jgi:hypothetical protein